MPFPRKVTGDSNTYKLYNINHNSWVFPSHGSFGIYSEESAASVFAVATDPTNSNKVTIRVAGGGRLFTGFAYSQSGGVYFIENPFF